MGVWVGGPAGVVLEGGSVERVVASWELARRAVLITCGATRPRLQALRLFVGVPVWTPHNRPAEDVPSRAKYLASVADTAVGAAA